MDVRSDTGRVEAFSDGVFAIAITLLVLEISVPEDAFDDLWAGIADEWPSYIAYVTSFLTIGAVWMQHHALFTGLRLVDSTVMRLNLALLMVVAFLPFPTGLMAEALRVSSDAERAGLVLYGATLLAIGVLLGTLWRYLTEHPTLLDEETADATLAVGERLTPLSRVILGIGQRRLARVAVYVTAIAVAIVFFPRLTVFAYLALAVDSVFSAR